MDPHFSNFQNSTIEEERTKSKRVLEELRTLELRHDSIKEECSRLKQANDCVLHEMEKV